METALLAAKSFGLLIATCLGVFGITHDYRDRTSGKLTRMGRGAIALLIFSALVALGAQLIEEDLKDKTARDASIQAAASAARSELVISDLARVLQPLELKSIHVSELAVPLKDERFSRLRGAIDATVADYQSHVGMIKPAGANQHVSAPLVDCTTRRGKCVPMRVEIRPDHPAFPRTGLESAVFRVANIFIALYRTPIPPAKFERYVSGAPDEADLSFYSGSIDGSEPLSIVKELTKGEYALTGRFSKMYLKRDASGKIISTPDLVGSQIFFRLPVNSLPDDMASYDFGRRLPKSARIKQSEVMEFQRKFELGAVAFEIGARTMWVPKKAWRKHITKTAVFWEYIVPPDPFRVSPDYNSSE